MKDRLAAELSADGTKGTEGLSVSITGNVGDGCVNFTATITATQAAITDGSAFGLTVGITGTSRTETVTVTVSCNQIDPSIKITDKPTNNTLNVGDTRKLGFTASPSNASVTWSSSNKTVATVSQEGVLTALAAGSSFIKVEIEGSNFSDQFILTVTQTDPSLISITAKPADDTLNIGDTFQLNFTASPSNASVTWSSSNETVATVSQEGLLTALAAGETTITVTMDGADLSDHFVLTVNSKDSSLQSVTITSKTTTMEVGHQILLTYSYAPENAAIESVKWTSSNPDVAVVEQNNLLHAIAPGQTTVTLTVTDPDGIVKTDQFDVSIIKVEYLRGLVKQSNTELNVGDTATFKLHWGSVKPDASHVNISNGSYEGAEYTYELSEDCTELSVTGKAPGYTYPTISYRDPESGIEYRGSFFLAILPKDFTVEIKQKEVTLDKGEKAEIPVSFTPENVKLDVTADEYIHTPTESIENHNYVTGSYENGILTARVSKDSPYGECRILLSFTTAEGFLYQKNVIVDVAPAEVSLSLEKETVYLDRGEETTVKISFTPENADIKVNVYPDPNESLTASYKDGEVTLKASSNADYTDFDPNWVVVTLTADNGYVLTKEMEVYIIERETIPPVIDSKDPLGDLTKALDNLDPNALNEAQKKDVAEQVISQVASVAGTVTQAQNQADKLTSLEEKLGALLDIKPEKVINSNMVKDNDITFIGALLNVEAGQTPTVKIEDVPLTDSLTSGLNVTGAPAVLDIKLLDENANPITNLNVPMQLKIKLSSLGLDPAKPIVIRHIKEDGTVEMLSAKVEGDDCVFWVNSYSTFVFANTAYSGGGSSGGSSSGGSSSRTISSSGSWMQTEAGWKYTYSNGTSATNTWLELSWNGKVDWYHFNAQSILDSGWYTEGDYTYYLYPTHDGQFGRMVTGWNLIDGKWYYFHTQTGGPKGSLLKNSVTPDGYTVGADGAWITQ